MLLSSSFPIITLSEICERMKNAIEALSIIVNDLTIGSSSKQFS
jgi:hypothetical protein